MRHGIAKKVTNLYGEKVWTHFSKLRNEGLSKGTPCDEAAVEQMSGGGKAALQPQSAEFRLFAYVQIKLH